MKQDERHTGVALSLLTYKGRYGGIAEGAGFWSVPGKI